MRYDPRHWILDGKTPVPAELLVWAAWFEQNDRCVAETFTRNGVRISTVFLGLDHRFTGDGPPLLFETCVFGGWQHGIGRRYSTWDEAEAGHLEAVALAEARLN
jgi:hypothetical protein